MSDAERRRRAEMLAETGKGIAGAARQAWPAGAPALTGSNLAYAYANGQKKKVTCRTCYQEWDLPAGTMEWTCDVCGSKNVA